jgi:hypothetical protein
MFLPRNNSQIRHDRKDYGGSTERLAITVIFFMMPFFTSSYITGQVSFSGKESSMNKQFISQKKSSDEERVPFRVMSWNVEIFNAFL